MDFRVGKRRVEPGQPCFIMAEVGLAHDGSLTQAHAYVDAIKRAALAPMRRVFMGVA